MSKLCLELFSFFFFFFKCLCFFHEDTSLSLTLTVLLSLSPLLHSCTLSLYCRALSLSPSPLPFLLFPHLSLSMSLPPTLPLRLRWLGVFLLPSHGVSLHVCVWRCVHVRTCLCLCVSPQCWAVSLSLPPGSEEPPSSRPVIGQGSGVLDTAQRWLLQDVFQQMVEVRECHHIGERIRGERLSSRSCVVPTTLQLQLPAARYKPLYERREIWWRNTRGKVERNPHSLPHSPGQLSAPLLFRYFHFSFCLFIFPFPCVPLHYSLWGCCSALAGSFWCSTQSRMGFHRCREFMLSVQQHCVCWTS